jgi:AraC-like DNA-binding protein
MNHTMLTSAIRVLWRLIKAEGADPDAIFKEAGLNTALINEASARYPVDNARQAWHLAADHIKDPCFGIRAGRHCLPSDFHALGYAFLSGETLHVGLNRIALYNEVVTQGISFYIEEDDEHLILSYTNARRDLPDIPALEDACWSIVLTLCRMARPEGISPVRVDLIHGATNCRKEDEDFYGCPVNYSQRRSALFFRLADVEQPLTAVNTEVAAVNEKALEDYIVRLREDEIQHKVARMITKLIASGQLSDDKVAQALGLSSRTLQRKLSVEGTTFKQILESIREKLALQYINDERLSFSEISFLLGFSEQSSFTRAFKRWTGTSPTEARQSRH